MKKIPFRVSLAHDIKLFHKKVSTYFYLVLAIAPQVLPLLSTEVRDSLPSWVKASLSVLALAGVAKNLVKVNKTS